MTLALAGSLTFTSRVLAQGAPPPPDARRALLVADRRASDASARGGIVAALRDAGHERLTLLYENAPVVAGRDNVLALLGAQPGTAGTRLQWASEHGEVSADSTVGFTWGMLAAAPQRGGPIRFGRYLAGWRREGGAWKLTAMAWIGVHRPDSTVVPAGLATGAPADGIPASARGPADADRAFAARGKGAGAPVAFDEFAAADAIGFSPGELAIGPRAIRDSFGPGGAQAEWIWGPVVADAAASGDLGWTIGEATIRAPGAAEPSRSKYLTLWRREGTSWKYVADGGNSRPSR